MELTPDKIALVKAVQKAGEAYKADSSSGNLAALQSAVGSALKG
jgi:hypothetical protein